MLPKHMPFFLRKKLILPWHILMMEEITLLLRMISL